MSQTTTVNTRNQLTVKTDSSKLLLGRNKFITGTYTNSSGSDVTLSAGMVFGRIATTRLLAILASGASDGSQLPLGVLVLDSDVTVSDGESLTLTLVNDGDVNENMLSFDGSDSLDTVVSGKTLRDRIGSDTLGIKLIAPVENTLADNE